MRIEIAGRFRPYSHLPGTRLILPGTAYRLTPFPARLLVEELKSTSEPLAAIDFDIEGPLDDFTILQDLEKGLVKVWGKAQDGFFRYQVKALSPGKGILVSIEKAPQRGVLCACQGIWKLEGGQPAHAGDVLTLGPERIGRDFSLYQLPLLDRLSLGSHKAQDWELIRRRGDFAEILPIWHRLGQLVEMEEASLGVPFQRIAGEKAPEKILPLFRRLYFSGFEGMLSPRLHDTDFQGIRDLSFEGMLPLQLLKMGSRLIRSLFLQEEEERIFLLPSLPPEFHCGRLVQTRLSCGELSMEWSKKMMRQCLFTAKEPGRLFFSFCKGEVKCRLRTSASDKGIDYFNGTSLQTIAGQTYWFDNFEK